MKKVLIILLTILSSNVSFAAGMTFHQFATEKAIDQVAAPELRDLLNAHKDAVLTGTNYPDFGSAMVYLPGTRKRPDLSPITHEPEFVDAYLSYIKDHCQPRFTGCEDLVAHFLGTAAHDMEDRLFDNLFLPRAGWEDFHSKEADYDFDTHSDMIAVIDFHRCRDIPRYYTPVDALVEIYQGLGTPYTAKVIVEGGRLHRLGTEIEHFIAPLEYCTSKKAIPWLEKNMGTYPGGLEYDAAVIARYWGILWERLQGRPARDKLVLDTFPAAGQVMPFADHDSPQTWVAVFFSTGIKEESVNASSFFVRDEKGREVMGEVKTGEERGYKNVYHAMFNPWEDYQRGIKYNVTLTTAIMDLHGDPLPENYTFSFVIEK